ncbi:hypothetical protein [Pedococcus bigeumensis]|uniref:hypothetical protein n=1 Tax=Pedococcus bigeumensis TaxID=433644 RepID=UPI002FEC88F8
MTSARTRTGLTLALACTPLLIAGAAHAETACGTPAVAAVYDTVHTDAVSHVELKWSTTVVDTPGMVAWDEPDVVVPATFKTVTVVDKEAWDETVVDKEAWVETVVDKEAWDETVVDKEAWVETVVDKEAWVETVTDAWSYNRYVVTQQASYYRVNQWRYRNIFGNTLYYDWYREGTSPSGSGWSLTGNYYWGEVPEQGYWETVPAVTHPVYHPAETHVVSHDAETHMVTHPAETHVVTHEAQTHVVAHPAVSHEEQAVDVPEHSIPGEHHDAVAEVSHQDFQWAATSPGEAWVKTDESRTVIDTAATDTPVLVTPAVSAGDACPTPTVTADSDAGDGGAGGSGKGTDPAPAAASASAVPALAHTGADGTAELLALGGALVLAGAGLKRVVRRRA